MKCLFLVAGYATRLYPLTENFPKSLLTVSGKTILDHLIDNIEETKMVDGYVLVSNSKFYSIFKKWTETRKENIEVIDDGTWTNETRLGAVNDIQFAISKLNIDDDLLVLAGDNLVDFSFGKFIDFFYSKGSTCVMRYCEENFSKRTKSAVMVVDDTDRVLDFQEKPSNPKSQWCSPPFYLYTKEDVKKIKIALKEGCSSDAPGSFIAWLFDKSAVYAYKMNGMRYDIGDLNSYEQVKRIFEGK